MFKFAQVAAAAMMFAGVVSAPAISKDMTGEMVDKAGYSLVATFRVKDGEADRFIDAMKKNTEASRTEPGVVVYRTYQTEKDSNVFINFEAYVDKSAFEAHLETPHVKTIGPILDEILSGPIEVEFLNNY